jgi:deoxyribonuclease V
MRFPTLHDWNLTPAEARALQSQLACRVDALRPLPPPRLIAAADVSYSKNDPTLFAAVVVVEAGTLEIVDRASTVSRATFPYVPGLLSFRECPPLLEAFSRLATTPDVVLVDGQGFAHPRRFGIGCHLGLWLGVPTVGCAKSRLCGTHADPPLPRGGRAALVDADEMIGCVLRTRDRVSPLYVSVGHLCDLESAVELVLATTRGLRQPTPARLAHGLVNDLRRMSGPRTHGM